MGWDPIEGLSGLSVGDGLAALGCILARLDRPITHDDLLAQLERAITLVELLVGKLVLATTLKFEDLADRSERGENVDAEAARLRAMLHDVTDIYRDLAHRYEDTRQLL